MTAWLYVALFLGASFLMIWRLEAMAGAGMEETALGALVMPCCTGMGNLVFAWLLATHGGRGEDVVVNCLVNNVTNLTLLVGLPAALWGMTLPMAPAGAKERKSIQQTLAAALVFTGAAWALGAGGPIRFGGGVALIVLFLLWQALHVVEAVRSKARWKKEYGWMAAADLALLAAGTWAIYLSTNWLVAWVSNIQTGWLSARHLGWLSGWLDVVPNAALAAWYGWKRQPEVVYVSQIGDGHICIPLCLGIFAVCRPLAAPSSFHPGMLILIVAAALHVAFVGATGRLPRWAGWGLVAAYAVFLRQGLAK